VYTAQTIRTLFLLGAMFLGTLHANARAEDRALKTAGKEKVDAVLLLDGSGSMRVTDPGRLRDEGAKLFLEFLKPGDRVAIVEFSSDAKIVRPLSSFERDQNGALTADVDKVGNSGEFTDILAGLKVAKGILEASPREDANQVVVLLSDGKLDPNPAVSSATAARAALVDELLPSFKEIGLKVHTLAFGDLVDRELLDRIAADTDGSSWFTPTASKIHESYAELFLVVKSPQVLPLTSKGFKIDAGIDEATFYINRESAESEISLRSSDGTIMTPENHPPSVRWFQGQKFDVVTVLQPRLGDWRINGLPTSDSFATVLTNLKLITDWPTASSVGSPLLLQARLYENEKPVVLREMAGATKYAFEITPSDKVSEPIIREFLFDDGTHGDKVAGDGIFSHDVELHDVGEYRLKVIARAPTFERSQQVPFKMKPRMVELLVEGEGAKAGEHGAAAHGTGHGAHDTHGGHAGDGGADAGASGTGDRFSVVLSPDAQVLRRVDVKLVATGPDKKRYVIPLEKHSEGYRGFASFLPVEGTYQLKATLTGETRKAGKVKDGGGTAITVREESNSLTYQKKSLSGEEPEVEVMVVKTEKEESSAPYYLVVLLVNAGLGGLLYLLLGRSGGVSREPLPEFASVQPLKGLLKTLEGREQLTEVDPNDPLFQGDEPLPEFTLGTDALQVTVETVPDSGVSTSAGDGDAAEPPPVEGGEAPPTASPAEGEAKPVEGA